uniref:ULP_PROTEASE domain-containing protein n=1 Tax=Panagrellus redivivus TaxID=6233 RepID=A0A7E4V9Z0_PANRE
MGAIADCCRQRMCLPSNAPLFVIEPSEAQSKVLLFLMDTVFYVISAGKRRSVTLKIDETVTYGELKTLVHEASGIQVTAKVRCPCVCIPDDVDKYDAEDKPYFEEATTVEAVPTVDPEERTAGETSSVSRTVSIHGVTETLYMNDNFRAFVSYNQAALKRIFDKIKPTDPIVVQGVNIVEYFDCPEYSAAVVISGYESVYDGFIYTLRTDALRSLYTLFRNIILKLFKDLSATKKDVKSVGNKLYEWLHLEQIESWVDGTINVVNTRRSRSREQTPKRTTRRPLPPINLQNIDDVESALRESVSKADISLVYDNNKEQLASWFKSLHNKEKDVFPSGSIAAMVARKFPSLCIDLAFLSPVFQSHAMTRFGFVPDISTFFNVNSFGITDFAESKGVTVAKTSDSTLNAILAFPKLYNVYTGEASDPNGLLYCTEQSTDWFTVVKDIQKKTTAPVLVCMNATQDPEYRIAVDETIFQLPQASSAQALQLLFELTYLLDVDYDPNMKKCFHFLEYAAGMKTSPRKPSVRNKNLKEAIETSSKLNAGKTSQEAPSMTETTQGFEPMPADVNPWNENQIDAEITPAINFELESIDSDNFFDHSAPFNSISLSTEQVSPIDDSHIREISTPPTKTAPASKKKAAGRKGVKRGAVKTDFSSSKKQKS